MKKFISLLFAMILCLTVSALAEVVAPTLEEAPLPVKFDLRYDWTTPDGTQVNVVSPVKLQNPFGTCWGFSIIAAAETSLKSELVAAGKIPPDREINLSERHLAWFVYSSVPEEEGTVNPDHLEGYYDESGLWVGEGVHFKEDKGVGRLDMGGFAHYGSTVFANGIGPVYESLIPYCNDENAILRLKDEDGESVSDIVILSPEEVANLSAEEQNSLICYSDTLMDGSNATWSVPDDMRVGAAFVLADSSWLLDTRQIDSDGNFTGVAWESVTALKKELLAGRAISIGLFADNSDPNEVSGEGQYVKQNADGSFSHYCYDAASLNHLVTIIGWDDSFPADCFVKNPETGLGPEGDGAWIVKNSWGSEERTFPNRYKWGTLNEKGETTGYFFVSYYDRSLSLPETFNFDIKDYPFTKNAGLELNSYTNLTISAPFAFSLEDAFSIGNIFVSDAEQTLESIAYESVSTDATITYAIYLLDVDAENPVDGEKVYETQKHYDYPGYHRIFLNQLEDYTPIHLAAGQKYGVVITEYSEEMGLYFCNIPTASGFVSVMNEEDMQQVHEMAESSVMEAVEEETRETLQETLLEKEPELAMDSDALTSRSSDAFKELWETELREKNRARIEEAVEELVKKYTNVYSVAVIHPGESFINIPGEWVDELELVDSVREDDPNSEIKNRQYDNFPIRTYSEMTME